MEKNINEQIEKGFKLAEKHEILRNEIINNEDVPINLRNELIKLKEDFEQQKVEEDKYIEENKHKKIIGYTENFMPIYEK